MDPRKLQFLAAVVGDDGARALRKAAEHAEELDHAIFPRTILAWLDVTSRFGHEGTVPGIEDVKLSFKKSEQGFDGYVTLDGELHRFDQASIDHLAGCIAVALGLDHERVAPTANAQKLAKLGKSIDLLVKSRVALEKTSWNVKQRRRYQFEPGANKPTLYPSGKPKQLTQGQVNARREAYVRRIGLDPVNAENHKLTTGEDLSPEAFPNAEGTNRLAYDSNFDAAHETAHAAMTPDNKNLGQYQQWLSDRAEPKYDDDDDEYDRLREEGGHHENVANAMETMVDRRAGVDPHMYQSQYRSSPKGESEEVLDPKSGRVRTNPTPRGPAPRYGTNPKTHFFNQDIRDQAREHLQEFDQGKKFDAAGNVTYPAGVDAAINARANPQGTGKLIKPAREGQIVRNSNAEHNKMLGKEEQKPEQKKITLPGVAAQPRGPQAPIAPTPTQPKNMKQAPAGAAGTAATPPLPQLPKQAKKKPTAPVTKSEAQRKCAMCGRSAFANDKYVGCFCFASLAKSVKTTTNGDGYLLEFTGLDQEEIMTLLEGLRGK